MSPQIADVTRMQIGDLKTMMNDFGLVRSVTFKEVTPGGIDVYNVEFEKGRTEWRILVGFNDIIQFVSFRRL
jgi:hypothetical protein